MILTFVFALCGIQMSPNASMLIFSSKDVNTISINAEEDIKKININD